MTWRTDTEFRSDVVDVVTDYHDSQNPGWTIAMKSGWHIGCPATLCEQKPAPGEEILLFGKGTGYYVRGVIIGGRVYRYETAIEAQVAAMIEQDAAMAKRDAEAIAQAPERDAAVAKMPADFRARIERFRAGRPRWRADFEPYEIFICEEAIKIAEALKTEAAIRAFHKLPYEDQLKQVEISHDHSGNTFAQAVRLAHCYVVTPDLLPKMHGGFCPLVGCAEYGCFAAGR